MIAAVVDGLLAILLDQQPPLLGEEGVAHVVLAAARRRLPEFVRPPGRIELERLHRFQGLHGSHRLHRRHGSDPLVGTDQDALGQDVAGHRIDDRLASGRVVEV